MERALIVGLALAAVVLGSSAAVLRPALVRLGEERPPRFGSGVTVLRWGSRGGGTASPVRGPGVRRQAARFAGRGPGGAK